VRRGRLVPAIVCLAGLFGAALAGGARADGGGIGPGVQADLRRGMAMVGPGTSDEPALRAERMTREPSPAFMLGAALGAWIGARATLDFDLKTPSGDGDDSAAIAVDCFDERTAFAHLEARSAALGLAPSAVIEAAGAQDPALPDAWRSRRSGAPPRCR